jgi:hypothetical protein
MRTAYPALRAMQEVVQQIVDAVSKNPITDVKESRKQEGGDKDHNGCAVHFLLTGPRDTLHLNLNFLVIVSQPLPRSTLNSQFVCHSQTFVGFVSLLTAADLRRVGWSMAGAEGFEPPRPVLETGSLAVKLTPLNQSLRASSPPQNERGFRGTTSSRPVASPDCNLQRTSPRPRPGPHFTSLCGVWCWQVGQNFFNSSRSWFFLLFLVVV